jgi:hypothetical protein
LERCRTERFGWKIDATKVGHDWSALIAGKNAVVQGINTS